MLIITKKNKGDKIMKIVIAIDSLKGSLSSIEAGEAIKAGIEHVYDDAKVIVSPLADGGEGTVEALTEGMDGNMRSLEVTGPLGTRVVCQYGIITETKTAIIEMASAAGITLVAPDQRNPLLTTTYGVGEIIADAITMGCRHFIIGIGGSATNDGGIGMLQALGGVVSSLNECTFKIACDVNNPLCGKLGSSAVYGPQKGATAEMIKKMDKGLNDYAKLAKLKYPNADPELPGTGAAGGLGFAFLTFLNAQLESGIKIVLEETRLEEYIKDTDIVITGEGRLDFQTAMGKAPIGVAKLAKKYHKPVIAFAGSVTADANECNHQGIDAYFPIVRGVTTLEEAMESSNAKNNLIATVEQVFRLWKIK